MDLQYLLSIAWFAAMTSGTPGPNNVMLTASGAHFGYLRSMPHMLGIVLGILVMNLLVAGGLGVVFTHYPWVKISLKVLASGYLLYLAWKIATTKMRAITETSADRPMRFFSAALFQFVNPKAWMMVVTAMSTLTLAGEDYWLSVVCVAAIFPLVGFPCISLWTAFGTFLRQFLATEQAQRRFSLCMGMMTAACLLFVWVDA